MTLLKDKLALITGAGGGLGSAIAQGFARQGARVIAADIDAARAQATAQAITSAGGQAWSYALDVTKREAVRALAAQLAQQNGPIDILINNAGIVFLCSPMASYVNGVVLPVDGGFLAA